MLSGRPAARLVNLVVHGRVRWLVYLFACLRGCAGPVVDVDATTACAAIPTPGLVRRMPCVVDATRGVPRTRRCSSDVCGAWTNAAFTHARTHARTHTHARAQHRRGHHRTGCHHRQCYLWVPAGRAARLRPVGAFVVLVAAKPSLACPTTTATTRLCVPCCCYR